MVILITVIKVFIGLISKEETYVHEEFMLSHTKNGLCTELKELPSQQGPWRQQARSCYNPLLCSSLSSSVLLLEDLQFLLMPAAKASML